MTNFVTSEKESPLKVKKSEEKNLFPRGATSFLLEYILFPKGEIFYIVVCLESVPIPLKSAFRDMFAGSLYRRANYSRTSIPRTPMARLPWLIRTRFLFPAKFFR